MNVCMLTQAFPRWKGDYSGIWIFQLSGLLVERGLNVHVVAPHFPGGKIEDVMNGIAIHRFKYMSPDKLESLAYTGEMHERVLHGNLLERGSAAPYIISCSFKVAEVVRRNNIDLIHAFWALPSGLIGVISKQLVRRPLVTHILGTDMAIAAKMAFLHPFVDTVFKHSDRILTETSTYGPTSVQTAIKLGAPPERIEMLPFGVDLKVFHPVPTQKGRKKVILYVGNLIVEKGLVYLIEASKKVIARFPNSEFILIGRGRDREFLVKTAERCGVKDHFKFLGALPPSKLPEYYSLSDIFVLPTLSEGLGAVILEAQACGACVVASDTGGVPEVIKDGKTGLLVKTADSSSLATAIIRLIEDEQLRQKLAANGRKYVEKHYAREEQAEKLISIYEKLASQ